MLKDNSYTNVLFLIKKIFETDDRTRPKMTLGNSSLTLVSTLKNHTG